MNHGFWSQLKKPFFVLAPMADVTDTAFRQIIARCGKPDVMFTEFISTDGLCSKEGRKNLIKELSYTEIERPLVVQIFGATPEHFYETAQLAQELGFDGIDINMGCPEKNIQKQGACAALIKKPALAKEIILATKKGAGSLPVSVKTRIGYTTNIIDEWLPHLLETEPAVITVHGRTKKEMSDVPAHWDVIGHAVQIARDAGSQTLIVGNGDVKNMEEGLARVKETGVDGIMIGRGIFGNPWLFDKSGAIIDLPTRLHTMVEHTLLFEKLLGDFKNFNIMKKHYKAYVNGFDGARELRTELMEAKNAQDVHATVEKFLKN